ncbi:MAG: TetR family transcriptional regulator [Pseudomonadota bacterium]
MRLKAENKAKVRARIVGGAAALFRERGYDAVNLDHIMEAAGLTRGAFYAHFKSKAELFADVARREHPILRLLQAREAGEPDALWTQMKAIFAGYLDVKNLDEVFNGCSLAALTGEVSRAGDAVRAGFELAWQDVRKEMARGQADLADQASLDAALVLASGAVTTAMACSDADQRQRVLSSAHHGFELLLKQARPE